MRKHKRKAYDFPVNENIPCWLSKAVSGVYHSRDNIPKYWYIDIFHGTRRPDLRTGHEGKELTKYFKDRYFFNYESDKDEETKEHTAKHLLNFVITILGAEKVKSDLTYQNFIKVAVSRLNSLKGREYYLKTRLILDKRRESYFLNRGLPPFISLEPDMKYIDGEDKHNSFILFGKNKLEALNKQRELDGKDRYK